MTQCSHNSSSHAWRDRSSTNYGVICPLDCDERKTLPDIAIFNPFDIFISSSDRQAVQTRVGVLGIDFCHFALHINI